MGQTQTEPSSEESQQSYRRKRSSAALRWYCKGFRHSTWKSRDPPSERRWCSSLSTSSFVRKLDIYWQPKKFSSASFSSYLHCYHGLTSSITQPQELSAKTGPSHGWQVRTLSTFPECLTLAMRIPRWRRRRVTQSSQGLVSDRRKLQSTQPTMPPPSILFAKNSFIFFSKLKQSVKRHPTKHLASTTSIFILSAIHTWRNVSQKYPPF